MSTEFLEIETKYDGSNIDRIEFKKLARSLNPTKFIYAESSDIYYTKSETEFLRYRMPQDGDISNRSELTFKKKHKESNNNIRTEVNLRVDPNDSHTVLTFAEGIGYKLNFSIFKMCDIYYFEDANIVYYAIIDENGKIAHFVEIECNDGFAKTQDEAWGIIQKYERLLSPLGISPQKRKKLSLFEMYKNEMK